MTVAELAGALIASWEGLKLGAYQDSGGVWTIGFGHTAGVGPRDICTREQAYEWLSSDSAALIRLTEGKPLHAAAAYVSFGFNCGYHALELVLASKSVLSNFVHDRHGNVLDGLVRRRAAEQALIDSVAP